MQELFLALFGSRNSMVLSQKPPHFFQYIFIILEGAGNIPTGSAAASPLPAPYQNTILIFGWRSGEILWNDVYMYNLLGLHTKTRSSSGCLIGYSSRASQSSHNHKKRSAQQSRTTKIEYREEFKFKWGSGKRSSRYRVYMNVYIYKSERNSSLLNETLTLILAWIVWEYEEKVTNNFERSS